MKNIKIDVLGTKYKIKYVTYEEMVKLAEKNGDWNGWKGMCDNNTKEIFVVYGETAEQNWLKDHQPRETLIHELLHAIYNELGWYWTEYNEEKHIHPLSKALERTIRQLPYLFNE